METQKITAQSAAKILWHFSSTSNNIVWLMKIYFKSLIITGSETENHYDANMSSLEAPTSCTTNDDKVVIMTTTGFQCIWNDSPPFFQTVCFQGMAEAVTKK